MEFGGSLPHPQQSTNCPYPNQINPLFCPSHYWQAQLISFLVGLRTYQRLVCLGASSHVTWFLHFHLMHRVVSTCSDVSEGVLHTFLCWLNKLKWILNWCWNNRRKWLEQRPPWQPDLLLHFTCVSAHAIRLVRYIPSMGQKSILVNQYGVERTASLVTNTRLLKVLGFWHNQTRRTPCVHFECRLIKTLTTVFRTHTEI